MYFERVAGGERCAAVAIKQFSLDGSGSRKTGFGVRSVDARWFSGLVKRAPAGPRLGLDLAWSIVVSRPGHVFVQSPLAAGAAT